MAVFFENACPAGWEVEPLAQGRMVVSVTNGTQGGFTVNSPLSDMEVRSHNHASQAVTVLASKSVSGSKGSDYTSAARGQQFGSNNTENAPSGAAFVQLQLCLSPQADALPSLPTDTVVFFDLDTFACPSGFVPLKDASGRVMVPSHDAEITKSDAAPLADQEDRQHAHTDDGSCDIATQPTDYEGIGGCCNDAPSASGRYPVTVTANASSTNVPYIQMLTCGSQGSQGGDLPDGALVFSVSELGCPAGWTLFDELGGRFPVVTPTGGTPGATFGGSPVTRASPNGVTHTHDLHGAIETQAAGVELVSGCCAHGYAENGVYEYACASSADDAVLPYLMAPLCRKGPSPALRGA